MSSFDNIAWINKCSNIARKEIKEKLDFVYIDANHSYEYVKKDMENYYPLIKKGGVLAGHDIKEPHHPGVLRAFNEFVKGKTFQSFITDTGFNSDWVIIK